MNSKSPEKEEKAAKGDQKGNEQLKFTATEVHANPINGSSESDGNRGTLAEEHVGSTTGTDAGISVKKNKCEEKFKEHLLLGCHTISSLLAGSDLPAFVKEHENSLSFPEKMMIMLMFLEKEFGKSGRSIEDAPIGWILHGRAFAIRDSKALVKDVLPLFFRQAKFSSFTRKLYRWEFRQINTSADARQTTGILFFANENFRRDKTHLLSKMKSVTAASMRRQKEKGGHSRSATDSKDPSKSKPAASSPVLESPISFGLQSLTSLATNPLFTSASGRLGPLSSSHVQQNALQQVLTAAGLHRHFALTSTLPFGTDSPTNALLVMMQSARNPFLPSALPQSFALAGSLAPNFHQQPSSDQEGFHTLLEALTRSSQQSPS